MNPAPIHWLIDLFIIIGGVNLFAAVWAAISWFNATRPPKLTERERFLIDTAHRAMHQKRAA